MSHLPTASTTTIVHAGVTKRVILPISKIDIDKNASSQPIPTLPGKQFLVSENSAEEGLNRALFWYRESLIGGLEHRGKLIVRWAFVMV
jgi:hypothetical protein